MRDMKILINGNLGYVGPVVVRHFRQAFPDAHLIGFDSGFFADCLMAPERPPTETCDEQHIGDVRQFPGEVLRGVDAVVQLAAISNDPMGQAFESPTREINATAVYENALRARTAGARAFVFASSCSVYGAGDNGLKDEDSPLEPLTAYARSKLVAEERLRALAAPNFRVTCLRFATACGFSPRLRLDLVLNDFVASALTTGRIEILSDGTPWRPLIHVADMARAMEWAIRRSAAQGEDFVVINTGSAAWNHRIRDLAEGVRRELGGVEVAMNSKAGPDPRSYRVDFSRFAALAPEHQPRVDLAAAVHDLASGLRGCGFAEPNFRNSVFVRLKVLRDLRQRGLLTDDLYWQQPATRPPRTASTVHGR